MMWDPTQEHDLMFNNRTFLSKILGYWNHFTLQCTYIMGKEDNEWFLYKNIAHKRFKLYYSICVSYIYSYMSR